MKALIFFLLLVSQLFASSIDRVAYQGRLLQANGAPISGPVDLTFKVYLNAVATVECAQTINGVTLSQGIFNVELTFPADCTGGTKTITQFMIDAADNGDSVYVEVTDDTNGNTYGKQMFTANTFAMVAKRVVSESVSNTSLMGINANCANGEVVQTDGLGNFYCGSVNGSLGSGIDAVLIGDGSVNNTEYQYLDGVTSNIQTQLNGKQAADADLSDLADGSLTGSKVGSGISATNVTTGSLNAVRVGGGVVDNTEFGYLNGVTSAIQTQLNAKQAADADLADLADGSLTATKIANGTISNTEFQYLNGVTSAIQTQLDAKQASGNYQPLNVNLTDLSDGSLTPSKVGSGFDAAKIGNGSISNTEFQFLNGVTSGVQTQLNAKQAADADLTDLADGSLTGSKVGTGISGSYITTGTVAAARIDSTISSYNINSAGTSGQVWKSNGSGRGAWGTDNNSGGDITGVTAGTGISGGGTSGTVTISATLGTSISSAEIEDGTITAADLATNSVAAAEIAAGAVGTSEVADNSLTASDLAANSVGTSEIASGVAIRGSIAPVSAFSTTATTKGDGGGYLGMNAKCTAQDSASHMCNTYELIRIMQLGGTMPSSACWTNSATGTAYSGDEPKGLNCSSWESNSETYQDYHGWIYYSNRFGIATCNIGRAVCCCK